ncbi:MAG TPA: FtsH protease activity modulator HflK [Kaistiaceae bacterium]|nr:FtsH protease activity modulator HflK [Kaistiaceae bacterium]
MPWSNQSGGGWKGGGGPWGSGGNGGGPWGSGPQGGGGNGGGGGQPPDLEELLRRSQDRLKTMLPGGSSLGAKGIALAVVAVVLVWLGSGFYRVQPDELGVELVFGKLYDKTQPGLNYNFPYPIGAVFTPKVLTIREMTIGLRDADGRGGIRDVPEESLMLTGDENIVDVDFKVQWRIKDAVAYLFNIQNPEGTVKAVAESAMREMVGRYNIQPIITEARQKIEASVQELMQGALDSYEAGIEITQVQMQKVDPPLQVIDAFRDVQAARADQERAQNEAQAYSNKVIPEARGEAARIVEDASAYRDKNIAEARGQADRFLKIYGEYRKAPEVTRERMFLETMERVFSGTDKIILDDKAGGVVPYLPLDQLNKSGGQTSGGTK